MNTNKKKNERYATFAMAFVICCALVLTATLYGDPRPTLSPDAQGASAFKADLFCRDAWW